ncbi:MAG: hypothetical protein ACOCSF_06895 [Halanaeroarchaeum sp.]
MDDMFERIADDLVEDFYAHLQQHAESSHSDLELDEETVETIRSNSKTI